MGRKAVKTKATTNHKKNLRKCDLRRFLFYIELMKTH